MRPTTSSPDWLGTRLTIVDDIEKVKYLLNYSDDAGTQRFCAQCADLVDENSGATAGLTKTTYDWGVTGDDRRSPWSD
jgi:hypothetical protein